MTKGMAILAVVVTILLVVIYWLHHRFVTKGLGGFGTAAYDPTTNTLDFGGQVTQSDLTDTTPLTPGTITPSQGASSSDAPDIVGSDVAAPTPGSAAANPDAGVTPDESFA